MSARTRIDVIVGTRPEAIKLAPVILELRGRPEAACRIVATAQHRELLDQGLAAFRLKPDVDLDLMQPGQTLAGLTARCLTALDDALADDPPAMVLVQGDTTTTFVGTLTAFYRRIPVGHVEAGLRTGDLMAPWPEEANRRLVSRLASLHFAPTENARQRLLSEGTDPTTVHVTGNTVVDALRLARDRVRDEPPILPFELEPGQKMVLVTAHRRESHGPGLAAIARAVDELARRFGDVLFVVPVHPNPEVRTAFHRTFGALDRPNVRLVDPLPYLPFVALMNQSLLILTDSGGIQEEAPSLGVPVLVLRERTERTEALDAGTVRLVGTDPERIVASATEILKRPPDPRPHDTMALNPYGDGHAARRIVELCLDRLAARTSEMRT